MNSSLFRKIRLKFCSSKFFRKIKINIFVISLIMKTNSKLVSQIKKSVKTSALLVEVPSKKEAFKDIACLFDAMAMHKLVRFKHQKFWEKETDDHIYAKKLEGDLRLESVAEHSWHVADSVLLIAPRFKKLSLYKCLSLSILHDKLELITGDYDPVGSGRGDDSHAFSSQHRRIKLSHEKLALEQYISTLGKQAAIIQRELLDEYIQAITDESQFVAAVDKLQAFSYVIEKKNGNLSNEHIYFTLKYTRKSVQYFAGLINHYLILVDIFLNKISKYRNCDRDKLDHEIFSQYEFEF